MQTHKFISNFHFLRRQDVNSLSSFSSKKPKKSYLSKYLIVLLYYGGVPKEYFLGLLTNALENSRRVSYDTRAALRVSLNYGEMDDFLLARMILSGIPIGEPHLQNRLAVLMREDFKSLREGKLPINESYYLMGTADPTGILNTDQVCVILENGQISGDVLVYRHPGLHFGDIHVMKAVYVKELEDFIGQSKYAIFFPAKGPRSIADEIANGDFDGDTYWVSRNTMLLNWFRPSKPWVKAYHTAETVHHSKPTQFSADELEDELFTQFLTASFCSNCIGLAANSWLGLMDRLLIMGEENTKEKKNLKGKILQLSEIYYDALDAAKTGKKVKFLFCSQQVSVPKNLRAEKSPHFLRKNDSDTDYSVYHSTSVLGLIYDTVESYEESSKLQGLEVRKLPSFDGEIPRSCLVLWKERYDKYQGEMSRAMQESEYVKGKLADAVIQKYKQMLYNATEFNLSTRNKEDKYNEALAIYHICYDYAKDHGVGLCSFAWRVAGQALCDLFVSKQSGTHFVSSRAVLREVLNS
ncbi:hypothetical protein MKX01_026201 [Papaver californicum]|nr:hypothetical protein MKX01_026201 [Papaver californicum]